LQIELVRFSSVCLARRSLGEGGSLAFTENSQIPSEKHAEYCRAEYEPEYNHTNQNVAHPALPRSDTPTFR